MFSFETEADPKDRCVSLPKNTKFITASATQKLVVPWTDLRVGDTILKCKDTAWNPAVILSVDGSHDNPNYPDTVKIIYKHVTGEQEHITHNLKELMWTVRRAAQKKDDRFPHACPRCKKPAYIGFSAVECSMKCS